MRDKMTRFLTAFLLFAAGLTATAAAPAAPEDRPAARKPIIGDFSAEIRRRDGRIDIEANIAALKAMNANTYFYLIWHNVRDWDDLPAFAAAAQREGIDVWVYLVPWSETPEGKKSPYGYSEPFKTDYVRWAEEIAKLSLDHRNVVGYVIDDFYGNSIQPDRFTTAYVRRFVSAGKAVNSNLRFYPLVYFQQPWQDFMSRFGDIVDGVVAAYPKSRTQVGNALVYLNDRPHGASAMIDFPRSKTSSPGDKGTIYADLRVRDAAKASISFYYDVYDSARKPGYHMPFVRVDGKMIWDADTANPLADDHVVDLDLSRYVKGKKSVRIELGVVEDRGVAKYPVTVRMDDIRTTGFDADEMTSEKLWHRRETDFFTVDLLPASNGGGRFHLPMILMPAGEPEQFEKRHPEPATPRNIAARVEMCLGLVRDGRVEGVVTYCLPKTPAHPVYEAVRREFVRAGDAVRRDR